MAYLKAFVLTSYFTLDNLNILVPIGNIYIRENLHKHFQQMYLVHTDLFARS